MDFYLKIILNKVLPAKKRNQIIYYTTDLSLTCLLVILNMNSLHCYIYRPIFQKLIL